VKKTKKTFKSKIPDYIKDDDKVMGKTGKSIIDGWEISSEMKSIMPCFDDEHNTKNFFVSIDDADRVLKDLIDKSKKAGDNDFKKQFEIWMKS